MPEDKKGSGKLSPSFVTGAIALVFLAIGYQTALFMHRAAALKILSDASVPDTVFVYPQGVLPQSGDDGQGESASTADRRKAAASVRHGGRRPERAEAVAVAMTPRTYESFRFDPNTVTVGELCRLGFSRKQAESIDSYRRKGGRFRRKEDFAKSYVVADSVYSRLKSYIDIPLLDINSADSAAFDDLPGIGGYFASRIVTYRRKLGGYSYKEQLMDIYHLDSGKYSAFADLITIEKPAEPFRLWSMPPDSLMMHPYIHDWPTARAIDLYRRNNSRTLWTVEGLRNAGILNDDMAFRLSRCRIASP